MITEKANPKVYLAICTALFNTSEVQHSYSHRIRPWGDAKKRNAWKQHMEIEHEVKAWVEIGGFRSCLQEREPRLRSGKCVENESMQKLKGIQQQSCQCNPCSHFLLTSVCSTSQSWECCQGKAKAMHTRVHVMDSNHTRGWGTHGENHWAEGYERWKCVQDGLVFLWQNRPVVHN